MIGPVKLAAGGGLGCVPAQNGKTSGLEKRLAIGLAIAGTLDFPRNLARWQDNQDK
jgi:hypothetical protein